MVRITSRVADVAYLLLRLVAALLFAEHGPQKLFGLLGGSRMSLMSELGLAGVIELAAGAMVACTRCRADCSPPVSHRGS